jgi:hypothetical protein
MDGPLKAVLATLAFIALVILVVSRKFFVSAALWQLDQLERDKHRNEEKKP